MRRPGPADARAAACLCTLVAACSGETGASGEVGTAADSAAMSADVPVIAEAYETPRDTADNIDSAAVWHAPDGRVWLLATAKDTDVIVVVDATTGEVLRRVGGEGTEAGRFDRPNGIAVIDDLLWVVERDNARVQLLRLPDFAPIGVFGAAELRRPYGIAIVPEGGKRFAAFITDNYEFNEDVVPPDSLLGERVRHFRVTVADDSLQAELINTFGDTRGPGVLRVVESLAADPAHDLVLIADEQEGASVIKAYTRTGSFTGRIIDRRHFPNQAEGIVLYTCGEAGGYWVATDQSPAVNTFHLFERTSLAHLGSFRGRTVRNTDGIALTRRRFPGFPAGAFFAVHDDGSVAAFRWDDIANALGLRLACTTD